MSTSSPHRARALFTAAVALAVLAHLAWDATHGGIPSHHLLNDAALPAVSNAWGAVLLPALAWWLTGRIQQRVARLRAQGLRARAAWRRIAVGFGLGMAVGLTLAVAFTVGAQAVASATFMGLLIAALVLPVYRAECVLGFVLAMAYTFGPVLPVGIAAVIAGASFASNSLLRALARRVRAGRSRGGATTRPA